MIFFINLFLLCAVYSNAQVTNKEADGVLESAIVKWDPISGANNCNVYYTVGGISDQKIQNSLILSYGTYMHAAIAGLAADNYTIASSVVSYKGRTTYNRLLNNNTFLDNTDYNFF